MDIPCLVPQLNHREKTLPLDPPTPAHAPYTMCFFSVVRHIGRRSLASARPFSLFIVSLISFVLRFHRDIKPCCLFDTR